MALGLTQEQWGSLAPAEGDEAPGSHGEVSGSSSPHFEASCFGLSPPRPLPVPLLHPRSGTLLASFFRDRSEGR